MAYPGDSDISSWASNNSSDPEPVYAFAATKGRLPLSPGELSGWTATELANPVYANSGNPMLIYAYIIDNRGDAPSNTAFIAYLNAQGYDANGVPTGQLPQVGQGYDQAVGITTTSPTTTPSSMTPTPPDFFSQISTTVSEHPVVAGVVGLAALFGLYKLTGRRR